MDMGHLAHGVHRGMKHQGVDEGDVGPYPLPPHCHHPPSPQPLKKCP